MEMEIEMTMTEKRYVDLTDQIVEDEGIAKPTVFAVLQWLDRNEDQAPLIRVGDTGKLTTRLRDSFISPVGCGSDMQGAITGWSDDGTVSFNGEGSVDVGHAVEEVIMGIENLRAGNEDA